jgi:hypothetical protein
MAQIAAQNEFGTEHIPARPFVRSSYDENLATITRALSREYDKILAGDSTVNLSLKKIGALVSKFIVEKIKSIQTPPNSPRTIAIKKSSKPLVDFGQMRQSVRYTVVTRK